MQITRPIILASASKERLSILKDEFQHPIQVLPANIDETPNKNETIDSLVKRLSYEKGKKIFNSNPNAYVLSADTLVESNGKPLGKPKNRDEAKSMMLSMLDQKIQVWTSSCVFSQNHPSGILQLDHAILYYKDLDPNSQLDFLQSEIWKNKAGGFSIQHDPCPVNLLNGDIYAVRGISLAFIKKILYTI